CWLRPNPNMPSTSGDLLASVRERAHSQLFWRTLGVQVEDAREGWVRLRVPARDELRNAVGAPVHGGVLSALVDMAGGGAPSQVHAPPPGRGDVAPEARILRRGRTIAFGEAAVTDAAGTTVAVGRATYMILAPT